MAQGVVDNLEVVDIEEQDREAGLPPVRELHAVGQVLPEEGAVGQAGQLVVERSAAELPRRNRELGRSVGDPALDLAEGSFELLAEEVHAGRDGIDDIPVGTDQGAGVEPERGELLDGAHDVFQTSLETPGGRFGSVTRGLLCGRRRCGSDARRSLGRGLGHHGEPTNARSQATADASLSNSRTGNGGLFTLRKKVPSVRLRGVSTIKATADTASPNRAASERADRSCGPDPCMSTNTGLRRPPVSCVIAWMAARASARSVATREVKTS